MQTIKNYVDSNISYSSGGSNPTDTNADSVDNLHFWVGTQAQYNAISTKDANTVYLIRE